MTQLDQRFRSWVQHIAENWNLPMEIAAGHVGREEIKNRISIYTAVKRHLQDSMIPWNSIFSLLRSCWPLGGRFDAIRFNRFVEHGHESVAAIETLLQNEPKNGAKAVDNFIESAINLGYVNRSRGSADRAGAALLASVILTCANPTRFVDYRKSRWEHFARAIEYHLPSSSAAEGTWIVWAGEFARELSETPTYQALWGSDRSLWALAGICWDAKNPSPPIPDPPDPGEERAYTEGDAKRRLHLIRERSAQVVRRAKDLRKEIDPALHCEACGFSYCEWYGERGIGFIEAHHKIPLTKLRPSTLTRVEDLVLLCADCHRMIHQDPTLRVEELRELVGKNRHPRKG